MNRPTLIVFARAPAVGVGKTRLARDVGRVEAWRAYRAMSLPLIRSLARDSRWRTVVRMAPDRASWPGVESEGQGGGGLGERLQAAFRAHARGPVAAVGADAPDVTPERVWRAFQQTKRAGVVLGPAEDGGFWILAMDARRARTVRFPGVRWSSPYALADTRAVLGGRALLLETLLDVDTGEALRRWRRVQPRIDRSRA
ncbi:MAG: DUF2064 domain-containing protein [Proteobacteria bacterium]|nr:DUF2064 domain-containing protein [Pseudomonadota bacterium]MBW3616698.1 DUF2064 domain-containing protein [Pseudomonadota bacterium]